MSLAPADPVAPARFATAAAWLASLGNVPAERIVFDPLPGTATEADLVRLVESKKQLCELIDGTLVEKSMGFEESEIALLIGHILLTFVKARRLGTVVGEAGMMRILERKVRIPDVAFLSAETLRAKRPGDKVPKLAPDLAVEVISDGNTPREMQIKLAEYFEAGTRLVWYVDPRTRTVDVYTSPTNVTHLTDADTLTGGDVLPGFSVAVAELFAIE